MISSAEPGEIVKSAKSVAQAPKARLIHSCNFSLCGPAIE